MKIKRLSDNKVFEVRKYIKSPESDESVWCEDWYGRHVIGQHCEWVEEQKMSVDFIPYQLCPKCNGQGTVTKPPYIPGDVYSWDSTSIAHTCDVCDGKKTIPQYNLKQHQ